uniref:Uncharacterized protein n=1 Tax=Candidatus Kentrum sp. MB TaxID=2138164 RepID=A0A450XYJ0_9GAMM|nr:MAG: hypothetical protein BECKMB1821G_GA0114241_100812 [Candidatus Kentron sp. MB]VFK34307.1 MAG: hypothetical protein BECKMB1821I_GA0114274_106711 [Candidatus Kentron sp. MB]VFK76645.1 MAG: hypothetical protein BECKMB1821H_GA0114242_106611 [Candidatus Kentron sp. MB]
MRCPEKRFISPDNSSSFPDESPTSPDKLSIRLENSMSCPDKSPDCLDGSLSCPDRPLGCPDKSPGCLYEWSVCPDESPVFPAYAGNIPYVFVLPWQVFLVRSEFPARGAGRSLWPSAPLGRCLPHLPVNSSKWFCMGTDPHRQDLDLWITSCARLIAPFKTELLMPATYTGPWQKRSFPVAFICSRMKNDGVGRCDGFCA